MAIERVECLPSVLCRPHFTCYRMQVLMLSADSEDNGLRTFWAALTAADRTRGATASSTRGRQMTNPISLSDVRLAVLWPLTGDSDRPFNPYTCTSALACAMTIFVRLFRRWRVSQRLRWPTTWQYQLHCERAQRPCRKHAKVGAAHAVMCVAPTVREVLSSGLVRV